MDDIRKITLIAVGVGLPLISVMIFFSMVLFSSGSYLIASGVIFLFAIFFVIIISSSGFIAVQLEEISKSKRKVSLNPSEKSILFSLFLFVFLSALTFPFSMDSATRTVLIIVIFISVILSGRDIGLKIFKEKETSREGSRR